MSKTYQEVLEFSYDSTNSAIKTKSIAGGQIPYFDYQAMTYVVAGNGAGQIETITYKTGGSGGTTVLLQTLTYDASNRVASMTWAF